MIFNTWDYYLLFLIPAAVLFRICGARARSWVIFASGCLFFSYFSYVQIGGIFGVLCLGLLLWESFVSRFYKPRSWFCLLGIAQTILVLAVFKYRNFLTGLIWPVPQRNPLYWKNAFLPLGISFFRVHPLRSGPLQIKPSKGPWQTTWRSFSFPHHGCRANQEISGFPTEVECDSQGMGSRLAARHDENTNWACKEVRHRRPCNCIHKPSELFGHCPCYARRTALWLFAYGLQIYIDFSAYSDIAIGSARLFGIRVPENFDWPYLETNIAGFWRHWHISLTNWLIDFIPLGGSRERPSRTYANIILVSGLWHGAGFGFVVWGLVHGLMLAIRRLWRALRGTDPEAAPAAARFCSWLLTFVSVNFAWAFFCMDLHTAFFFFRRLIFG